MLLYQIAYERYIKNTMIDENNSNRISFKLRDYQENAAENIERIFNGDEYNRYAGLVLPTGAGKSFVAIKELLSFNNPNYNTRNRNGILNGERMLYVAPQNEILSQVKSHIVKYVLLSYPNMKEKSIEELDRLIMGHFPELNFPGINSNKDEPPVSDNASGSEKLSAIMRRITPQQIDVLVRKAFPGLKFRCYAGIKDDENKVKNEDILEAKLIISDESQKVGAEKSAQNFEANIRKNKVAKVLGITATPERTDTEGRNMIDELARIVYQGEDVSKDKYIAQEIYVTDAVKDGIVNAPQIITPNAILADSEEYEQVLKKYNTAKDEETRKELGEILDQMEEIIGFSPRKLTNQQIAEHTTEQVQQTIASSIGNKNGKYIAFLPPNRAKNGDEKPDSAEYFLQYMERIKKDFEGVVDENGNPVKITFSVVSSNGRIKLDKNNLPTNGEGRELVNSDVIKEFENQSSESGGIKIILAVNIFNEGIHVDGVDGALMYRKTYSRTLFTQHLGRCTSSANPERPMEMQKKTQVIDLVGNSYKHIQNGIGNNISRQYDLYRLRQIEEWIKKHGGKMPDINKIAEESASVKDKARAEQEARMAISLKRLKLRYFNNRNGENLPLSDAKLVTEIVQLADSLKLWDTTIPERTVNPSEDELTGNKYLELSNDQNRFMKLYRDARKKSAPPRIQTRINKLLNILKILRMHKKDIKLPQGLYILTSDGTELKTSDTESLSLQDFLKENFEQEEIEVIISQLQNYRLLDVNNKDEIFYPDEEYDFGAELAFAKGKVFTSQRDWISSDTDYFENYSLKDLIELGLLDTPEEEMRRVNELLLRKTGNRFLRPEERWLDSHKRIKSKTSIDEIDFGLIKRFEESSLVDGRKYFGGNGEKDSGYDVDGYDKDGYDVCGYNRLGFNRDNIHKTTGINIDDRGFYFDKKSGKYINALTKSEFDLLGYNIYGHNEEGFERPKGLERKKGVRNRARYIQPLWYKRHPDGTYDRKGYREVKALYCVNEPKLQHDAHGFTPKNGNISNNPLLKQRREGGHFYKNGSTKTYNDYQEIGNFYLEKEKMNGNSYKVDIDGFDRNGFKRVKVNGRNMYIHRDTSSIYDKYGYIFDKKTLRKKARSYN